jgi:hypothetical protein
MKKLNFKKIFFNKYSLLSALGMFTYSAWKMNIQKEIKGATLDSKIYKPLEKKEANRRQDHITDISYDLLLNLSNPDNINSFFNGNVIIDFTLSQVEGLFLDFTGKIETLVVNGKKCLNLSGYKQIANRIYIEEKMLIRGNNKISIEFKNSYGEQDGLIYSKNGKTFYSKCEPFKAHHIFPCFDQPCFKSKINLKVISDEKMDFISNSYLLKDIKISSYNEFSLNYFFKIDSDKMKFVNLDDNREYHFYEFKGIEKIATHQLLICGLKNYKEVSHEKYNVMPIRIKIQENKNIDNPELLNKIISEFMSWFQEKFETSYPFERLNIYFLQGVKNVSMSFPGGVIIIDENFLESSLDTIDTNYLYLILTTHL